MAADVPRHREPSAPRSLLATPIILFFWDYDTQWGADRSRSPGGPKTWGHAEFENTEVLLDLHAKHGVPACFAAVGAAALPGCRPYHDPEQIRRIHAAGHEVGSHSFRHEWLPGIGYQGLRDTLSRSKGTLEQCVGAEVVSFVPPFNQPFDYPRGWSFSISERREGGPERTDLSRLCDALHETGYRFCRVAYLPLHSRLAERILRRRWYRPSRPETIRGITCVRLNTPVGFGERCRELIEHHLARGGIWVIHGHPHSISQQGTWQSLAALRQLLSALERWQRDGKILCALPRSLVAQSPDGFDASRLNLSTPHLASSA